LFFFFLRVASAGYIGHASHSRLAATRPHKDKPASRMSCMEQATSMRTCTHAHTVPPPSAEKDGARMSRLSGPGVTQLLSHNERLPAARDSKEAAPGTLSSLQAQSKRASLSSVSSEYASAILAPPPASTSGVCEALPTCCLSCRSSCFVASYSSRVGSCGTLA